MKAYEIIYENNIIEIKIIGFGGIKLLVNHEIQDEIRGPLLTGNRLYGKLPNGEKIKVSISAMFVVLLSVFVDNKLIFRN